MCGIEVAMKGVKDHRGNAIGNKSYWLKGAEMKYEYTHRMSNPKDGVAFWNRMLALLNHRLHSRLPLGINYFMVEDKDYPKKNDLNGQYFNGKMSVAQPVYS